MMLTTLIKRQLVIFLALTLGAVGLALFGYARVPALMGIGVYEVRVEYPDSSGLYPKARVTYQGVKVGEVSSLEVESGGAVATLRIDNEYQIPRGAVAELHSTSAIGEQYVDLVPVAGRVDGEATDDAYLEDGGVIPAERTVAMPQITPVLESVNSLLESVPQGRTRRVLDQVDEGLGGAGPDLAQVIDSTDLLLSEAQRQISATTSLIQRAEPVLRTQQDLRDETVGYASSLASFSTELADRDRDLRALLAAGPGGLRAASGLVEELQPTLPLLVTNLTTNAEVLNTYLPQIQEGLVYYPVTVARLQTAIIPRAEVGDVNLDLRLNVNNPPACSEGYLAPSERRDPSVKRFRNVDLLAHCDVPDSSPRSVRGARLLPCPQGPGRGPLPSSCGLRFGEGVWPEDEQQSAFSEALRGTGDSSASQGRRDGGSWKVLVLGPLRVR